MIARILGLVVTGGWSLVWFFAIAMAIWQILRGRALAGVALGAAAVTGIGILIADSLLGPVWQSFGDMAGYEVMIVVRSLVSGSLDALAIVLLVVAAVVQRPPKETG